MTEEMYHARYLNARVWVPEAQAAGIVTSVDYAAQEIDISFDDGEIGSYLNAEVELL